MGKRGGGWWEAEWMRGQEEEEGVWGDEGEGGAVRRRGQPEVPLHTEAF